MARASNDDIYSRLGNLEGTLRSFVDELRIKHQRDEEERQNMQADIRAADAKAQGVKDRQTWLMGVASGLATAGSALGYIFTAWVHSKMGQPQI